MSLCCNVLQLAALAMPFSSETRRLSWSQHFANYYWSFALFISEFWGGAVFVFVGDSLPNQSNVRNALLMGNHSGGLDFLSGVSVLNRVGIGCGRMMTLMKESLKFAPMAGWTSLLQGSLFLKRSWKTDQKLMTKKLEQMSHGEFPRPWWIGIYPEGTRITPKKREASQAFARSKNLPILNNVLLPRPKGFQFILEKTRQSVSDVFDMTIAYDPVPLYFRDIFLRGQVRTKFIWIHCKRYSIDDIPESNEEIEKWLLQRFVEKDQRMEIFKQKQMFPGRRHFYFFDEFKLMSNFALWTMIFDTFIFWKWGLYAGIFALFLTIYTALLATARGKETKAKLAEVVQGQQNELAELIAEEEKISKRIDEIESKAK